jgi:preprotein translocase subunit SecE
LEKLMGRILRKKPTIPKKKKRTDAESSGSDSAAAASGVRTSEAARTEATEPARKPEMRRAAAPPAGEPADNALTRALQFLREVKIELKKVTWPSRKEVSSTTLVVIATSIFFGFYLWGLDLVFSRVLSLAFKRQF